MYLLQSNLNRSIPVLGNLENMDLVWTPPIILPPSAFPWKAITGKSAVCVCRHRLSSNRWVISFTNFSYIRTPFSAHRDCHFSEMRQYLCGEYSSIVPKILQYWAQNTSVLYEEYSATIENRTCSGWKPRRNWGSVLGWNMDIPQEQENTNAHNALPPEKVSLPLPGALLI